MAKIDSCGLRPKHLIYLPKLKSKPGTRPSTPHPDTSHDRRPSTVPDEVLRAFTNLQNTRASQERRRTFEQIETVHGQRRVPQMLRTITSGDDSNDHSEEKMDSAFSNHFPPIRGSMKTEDVQSIHQIASNDATRLPAIHGAHP